MGKCKCTDCECNRNPDLKTMLHHHEQLLEVIEEDGPEQEIETLYMIYNELVGCAKDLDKRLRIEKKKIEVYKK